VATHDAETIAAQRAGPITKIESIRVMMKKIDPVKIKLSREIIAPARGKILN
jgi:hypothetical protein